jgi:hypothetical protein
MSFFDRFVESFKTKAEGVAKAKNPAEKTAAEGVFQTAVGEAFERWIEQQDVAGGVRLVGSILGVADLLAVVPPGAYGWVFNVLGKVVDQKVRRHNRLAAGILDTVLTNLGYGIQESLENARREGKSVEGATVRRSMLLDAIRKGFLRGTADQPEEIPVLVFEVLENDERRLFAALFQALWDAIYLDRPASTAADGHMKGLDGIASQSYEAMRHFMDYNPAWAKPALRGLIDAGVTPAMILQDPMKYGGEVYFPVMAHHSPSLKARARDLADIWVDVPAIKAWVKWVVSPKNITILAGLMIAAIMVLAAIVALAAGAGGLGAIIWFLGLLIGFYAPESGWVTLLLVAGLSTLYVGRLLFPIPGHVLRGITTLLTGKRVDEPGILDRMLSKFGKSLRALGIPVPEVVVDRVLRLDMPEKHHTGWFHRTATSISIVAAGLTAAFLILFSALADASFAMYATRLVCIGICFVAMLNDLISRTGWRNTFEEDKKMSKRVVRIFAMGVAVAVAFIICGGGITVFGASVHWTWDNTIVPAYEDYSYERAEEEGTLPEDDPYAGCTKLPCRHKK